MVSTSFEIPKHEPILPSLKRMLQNFSGILFALKVPSIQRYLSSKGAVFTRHSCTCLLKCYRIFSCRAKPAAALETGFFFLLLYRPSSPIGTID